jgi:predicted phage gp36 major capsid-like protein
MYYSSMREIVADTAEAALSWQVSVGEGRTWLVQEGETNTQTTRLFSATANFNVHDGFSSDVEGLSS